jgi:hypothetical protein
MSFGSEIILEPGERGLGITVLTPNIPLGDF